MNKLLSGICFSLLLLSINFAADPLFSQDLQWKKARGKFYLIDSCGKRISKKHFDAANQFFDFMYSTSVRKRGRWGAINREGVLIVPCKYDDVDCYTIPYPYNVIMEMPPVHHLIICQNLNGGNKSHFVYNLNGELLFSGDYDSVQNLLYGYLYCSKEDYDLLVSIKTKKGVRFDNKYNLMPYTNGKFVIINRDSLQSKYGIVDTTGAFIQPCIYNSYEEVVKFLE